MVKQAIRPAIVTWRQTEPELATRRALRQAGVELAGLVADDCSTRVPCVMTHASYARPLTARTKTANVLGSATIAGAVDRRDGPACIEDRPYGRPRRSSPGPWPLTRARRATSSRVPPLCGEPASYGAT